MPIIPPIRAFKAANIRRILEKALVIMNEITVNGASFCHVDRIKHEIHEIDVMTDGYHKWHGAIPIFRRRDINNMALIKFMGIELLNHMDILDMSITLDPKA